MTMTKAQIGKAKRRLKELHKQLAGLGPIMRGTIVRIGTRNKQFYFSVNRDKKTRLIYLGNKREPLARPMSENHKELLSIVEEMTILNMELLKVDALE
jgi:hypothetical protein